MPRRLRIAFVIAGALAVLVFAWIVSGETLNIVGHTFASGGPPESFYDAQARSLLHGHFDVPRSSIDGEAFLIDGRAYGYFGPTPALLRMPILLLFPSVQGHLNAVFMIAAFMAILFFSARLTWDVRRLAFGAREVGTRESVALACFLGVVGLGSTTIFLATYSLPYHEALIWGVAWTIAAFSYAIRFLLDPRRGPIAAAAVSATLALLSRATLGVSAVAVLAAFLIVAFIVRGTEMRVVRERLDEVKRDRAVAMVERLTGLWSAADLRRFIRALALATTVPVLAYVLVNLAKFGSLLSVPYEHHYAFVNNPARYQAALDNGGLVNLRYLPGNLLQYLRPDALGLSSQFPWLVFRFPPDAIANPLGVHLDGIEPHSSITATMPALTMLAIIGSIVAFWPRRREPGTRSVSALRILILCGFLAPLGSWSFAGVTQRYLGESIPVMAVAASIGVFALIAAARQPQRRIISITACTVIGLAAAFSVLVNLGLSIDYQHTFSRTPASVRRSYRQFQENLNQLFDADDTATVRRTPADRRPPSPRRGDLWAPTDCATLYWYSGTEWLPVGPNGEEHLRLRVRFANGAETFAEPIITRGSKGAVEMIAVRYGLPGSLEFLYLSSGRPIVASVPVVYRSGVTHEVDIDLDPMFPRVRVRFDGLTLIDRRAGSSADSPVVLGRNDIEPSVLEEFSGTIEPVTVASPACAIPVPSRG